MGGELLDQGLSPWAVVLGVSLIILLVASILIEADGWGYSRRIKREMEQDNEGQD